MARNGDIANDEMRDHLVQRQHEEAKANREAGAGFFLPGRDLFGGWELDLDNLNGRPIDECPDETPATFEVDGTFVCAKPKKSGRLSASGMKRFHVKDFGKLEAMREATGWKGRLQEWSTDPFAMGTSQQQVAIGGDRGVFGQYVPIWPGPVTRQLYWADYFAMSAKAFEAYNHDPISWRCVRMKQEFALGKGLQTRVTYSSGSKEGQGHDAAQKVWDEFWKRNHMSERLDMVARDISWGGEQFLRYFQKGKLTTVRSLDPASIYDIITDPEDHETVFAYHQQFQTPYQLYPPTASAPPGDTLPAPQGATQPNAATRYIIRQILPVEVDHYKANVSAYERRGRSDLFPALGWIQRLRHYLTSSVVRADMAARICWDLTVKGNQSAVSQQKANLFPNGQAPPPGSVFGHNEASTLQAVVPQAGSAAARWDPTLDALVGMVAASIGLPKDWLGFSQAGTRASALVATEPATRALEELQGLMEQVLSDCFDRVMAAAKITDADAEFTFPSIASEDRTQKLQDLAFAEGMGWVSKQTSASIAAKELGITSYDFGEEQELIAEEFPEPETDKDGMPVRGDGTIRRPMMVQQYRQAPKLDPTKSPPDEDLPPGLLAPTDGSAPPGQEPGANGQPPGGGGNLAAKPGQQPGAPKTPQTRGGMPADENPISKAGASNIKADNLRASAPVPAFTADQVEFLLRERNPRRRPDDPAFQQAAERYRAASAQNLAQLVRDAVSRDE